MTLSPADKRWIAKKIKAVVDETLKDAVIAIGGYDGATSVIDADLYEHAVQAERPRRVGFHAEVPESTT